YQFSVMSDAIIAGWISPFAVAALSYSERLIYLPIGVFAVAFGTVSLTEMSYMAQKKDYPQLISTQFSSMRYLLFMTVPLAAFLCVFHIPIIRLTYYRGLFDDRALMETAQAFPAALFVLLPATLVSLGVYLFTGRLEAAGLLPYLLGGAAGGILCGLIYDKLPQRLLRILFGALLIFGGIRAVMG
ncbi:MAG: hypothetical protein EOM69_03780, partial [Clostridia bacterium]|nr:hypothetical protein [Clostridia bacterium]